DLQVMSLTSYRTAPSRATEGNCISAVPKNKKAAGPYRDRPLFEKVNGLFLVTTSSCACCNAWRRPTLPCLETKYHRRSLVSRPSSRWDRVGHRRYGHQAMKQAHKL